MTDATTTLSFDARGQEITARQVEQVARALDQVQIGGQRAAQGTRELLQPLKDMEALVRLGALDIETFRGALRATITDLRAFGAQASLTAQQERDLATQIGAAEAMLRRHQLAATRTGNAFVRLSTGAQTLAFSMANGRVSAGGLLTSLSMLGIGSPAFIAITAGLAGIGTLISQVGDRTEETTDQFKELLHFVRAVGEASTVQRITDLAARAAVAQGRQVAVFDARTGLQTGVRSEGGDPAELARLLQEIADLQHALTIARNDAARERNAELERRRPRRTRDPIVDPTRAIGFPSDADIGRISDRRFAEREQRRMGQQNRDDAAFMDFLMPPPEMLAEANRLVAGHVDAIAGHLEHLQKAYEKTGEVMARAFEAAGEALGGHGNIAKAVSAVFLAEAQKRMRIRAVEEFAEGLASFSMPAVAAKHFAAAALFATGAGLAGSIGASLSVGGGGGDGARGAFNGARSVSGERGTTIVEIPSDNEILGRRNQAFQDLIRDVLEQLGQRNVLIRYT